jgi:hypothetical protein
MIENALSGEPNYSFIIDTKKTPIECRFAYNTEMIDIEESITFTKVNTQKTKELLLIERVKELTELVTPIFGYCGFGEKMIFNIDSKVLDFRPFDDFTTFNNICEYNKFKKVYKIIINTTSAIFTINLEKCPSKYTCGCRNIMNPHIIATTTIVARITCHAHTNNILNGPAPIKQHFNHEMIYLPSVTEIEVYFIADKGYTDFVNEFTKFESCPNLSKLTIIGENKGSVVLDVNNMLETSVNKKLKHIILKGMSPNIEPSTLDKAKLFIQTHKIRLDII